MLEDLVTEELVDRLAQEGFGDIVGVIMEGSCMTKAGRLNARQLAMTLGTTNRAMVQSLNKLKLLLTELTKPL
jgi:hypothetical protein